MATGAFYSDTLTPDSRAGGQYNMTGTGAPSQPKTYFGGSLPVGAPPNLQQDYITANDPARQQQYQRESVQRSLQYGTGSLASPAQTAAYNSNLLQQGFTNAEMMAQGMFAPQSEILNQQLARQRAMLGQAVYGEAPYREGILQRDNALARQALGIDERALGLDKNLTNTQLKNLTKLRGILSQQFGLNDATKSLGVAEAKDQAKRKQFDLRSELTARGAFNTVANERGTNRINTDLLFGLQGINLQHEGTRLGLTEKGVGYDNQQAQLQSRLDNIGLDYERLGLSRQQLANSLQDGLHQIGLDTQMTVNQLLDAMGGTSIQQSQIAGQIVQMIGQLAGIPLPAVQQLINASSQGSSRNQGPGYEQ